MTLRMDPDQRRALIVDACLAVMLRKGIAATTVRDVAAEMGSSPGLVHHYFASMDELLAAAFDQAAGQDLAETRAALAGESEAVASLRLFFGTYTRAEQDWAFQLWLDAWAAAARSPVLQETSQRLNVAWQQLLAGVIDAGVADGSLVCVDPSGSAWRILSLMDGLALQTVAHRVEVDRDAVVAWSTAYAERELGLSEGTLASQSSPSTGRTSGTKP